MDKKEALKELAEIDRVEAEQAARRAALRAIIEAPERPSRWEPEPDGGEYFTNIEGYAGPQAQARRPHSEHLYQIRLSRGDVHQTEAEARTYKLWLESFVPVYGLTVPSEEVLWSGWYINAEGRKRRCKEAFRLTVLQIAYLEGRWAPTEAEIHAKIERFGKVRGFGK